MSPSEADDPQQSSVKDSPEGNISAAIAALTGSKRVSGKIMLATQALGRRDDRLRSLLANPVLPPTGWPEWEIEDVVRRLAAMDANGDDAMVGVGEREGRVYSALVRRRHWGFAHGIGRSGCLEEVQPKAIGSSCLQRIANQLVKQALRVAGIPVDVAALECAVFPMATGMTLAVVLRALARGRPAAEYVLMPRIDQKSCVKCVAMAGLRLVIVPNRLVGEALGTDVDALEASIDSLGTEKIVAVVSTNSCFAPRLPDDLLAVGRACRRHGIAHVVNNAYGVQSMAAGRNLRRLLEQSVPAGDAAVDAIVQSCDKNFMVPVGGAIVLALRDRLDRITGVYPGRASAAPLLDLFITLLALGRDGLRAQIRARQENYEYFKQSLATIPGLRVLATPANDVSIAVTGPPAMLVSGLGARLFLRGVSGCRVVTSEGAVTVIDDIPFTNWGAHHDAYPEPYITVASAIGQRREEIDAFVAKLSKLLRTLSATARPAPPQL